MSNDKLNLHLLHQIVVDAASAHTMQEQIDRLVTQVRLAMGVDVSSLYDLEGATTLRLVANVGLAGGIADSVTLEVGEGLVGTVAATQQPINVARASSHPAYRYFPDIGEEPFNAFLGVPIVHLGRVIGVIVVQDREERLFVADEVSFLVTVAAQLAGNMQRLPEREPADNDKRQRRFSGRSGAPGKSIGRLHLIAGEGTLKLADAAARGTTTDELQRLEAAVARVRADNTRSRAQLAGGVTGDVLAMFDFYAALLDSDQLVAAAAERIRTGMSAVGAIRAAVDECVFAFGRVDDEYIRARSEDVRHVGNSLLRAVLGEREPAREDLSDVVLLASAVSITDIAALRPEQISGLVCFEGSTMSHTAVLARALGIPAVVDVGPIEHLVEGGPVIVDGDEGVIILDPVEPLVESYRHAIEMEQTTQNELLARRLEPSVTSDGLKVTLLANTGLLADIRPGLDRGAEGIGLYRSEIPFLAATVFPGEIEQTRIYRRVLETYHPLPVTMRTLDVGGDKQLPYMPIPEDNPALGWRGIRFTLDNPPVFVTQLRAMLRADIGLGNLRIMLPMVGDVSDVLRSAALLNDVVRDMTDGGEAAVRPPLGIMVEVPSAIACLDHVADVLDFVSIGSNDLTQYLLAVDRGNPRVAARYDHLHPAVLSAIDQIVSTGRARGLAVSLCGEMAADPLAVVVLIGLGITSLSMNAFSLPRVKAVVRALDAAAAAVVAREVMALPDAGAVRERVRRWAFGQGLASLIAAPGHDVDQQRLSI